MVVESYHGAPEFIETAKHAFKQLPLGSEESGLGVIARCQLKRVSELQRRLLATYLIPGCVGKGVRLGSKGLSAAACIQTSGNLQILKSIIEKPHKTNIPKIKISSV